MYEKSYPLTSTSNKICIVEVKGYDFSYIARKTLDSMLQMVPNLIYDFGFLIEGYTDDQLPEQVLISARVNKCPFEMAGIWEKPKIRKRRKEAGGENLVRKRTRSRISR